MGNVEQICSCEEPNITIEPVTQTPLPYCGACGGIFITDIERKDVRRYKTLKALFIEKNGSAPASMYEKTLLIMLNVLALVYDENEIKLRRADKAQHRKEYDVYLRREQALNALTKILRQTLNLEAKINLSKKEKRT